MQKGGTSKWTLKAAFLGDNHCEAWCKKYFETLLGQFHINIPKCFQQISLKKKWFSKQKFNGESNTFRNDQMVLLTLASYLVMDIPSNLQHFLSYQQETISHARWITTASGNLRLFLFHQKQLSDSQLPNLKRIAFFIVSFYVPSSMIIHLKSQASEGPFLSFFQRDLWEAFRNIDVELAEQCFEVFLTPCFTMVVTQKRSFKCSFRGAALLHWSSKDVFFWIQLSCLLPGYCWH